MLKKVSYFVILAFIIFSFNVLAVPPVQTTSASDNLLIAYPQYQFIKLNSNITVSIHVINQSRTITGNLANCYVDIYNPKGVEICSNLMTAGGSDYLASIKNNFSMLGYYSFIIQCNTTGQAGFANGIFEITNSGIELTSGKAFIDIGLLILLLSFFFVCIYIFVSFDNLLSRVGMLGLGYLLLIAITFTSWNMARDFLVSAPFMTQMFKILFYVLIVSALPLFIGAFAWYILMLFKIKEIQRLMDKGFSEDEAKRRSK